MYAALGKCLEAGTKVQVVVVCLTADKQPGLFIGFPNGGQGQRTNARGRLGVLQVLRKLCLDVRMIGKHVGHTGIGDIHSAAGEHEFSRHEGMAHVTTAHQQLHGTPIVAVQNEQRRGILGTDIRIVSGFFVFCQLLFERTAHVTLSEGTGMGGVSSSASGSKPCM